MNKPWRRFVDNKKESFISFSRSTSFFSVIVASAIVIGVAIWSVASELLGLGAPKADEIKEIIKAVL